MPRELGESVSGMSGITRKCARLVCEDNLLGMLQLFASVLIAESNKGGHTPVKNILLKCLQFILP